MSSNRNRRPRKPLAFGLIGDIHSIRIKPAAGDVLKEVTDSGELLDATPQDFSEAAREGTGRIFVLNPPTKQL